MCQIEFQSKFVKQFPRVNLSIFQLLNQGILIALYTSIIVASQKGIMQTIVAIFHEVSYHTTICMHKHSVVVVGNLFSLASLLMIRLH